MANDEYPGVKTGIFLRILENFSSKHQKIRILFNMTVGGCHLTIIGKTVVFYRK